MENPEHFGLCYLQVEEGLEEEDAERREMILSVVLPVLEEVVTPDEEAFVFPRDLVTSNGIVEDVVTQLIEDVAEGVERDRVQTVRDSLPLSFSSLSFLFSFSPL